MHRLQIKDKQKLNIHMENEINLNKKNTFRFLSCTSHPLFDVEVETIIFALPEAQRTVLVDNCRLVGCCIIRVENMLHEF